VLIGSEWIEEITLLVGLLQTAATCAVAIVVFRQTNRLKKVELTKQAMDAYNFLNSIALTKDENLRALDSIGRGNINESDEVRRKRWCSFVWLVALESTYIINENSLMDRNYANRTLEHQLEVILTDDLVFQLVLHKRN
jgi:hypothetical protein